MLRPQNKNIMVFKSLNITVLFFQRMDVLYQWPHVCAPEKLLLVEDIVPPPPYVAPLCFSLSSRTLDCRVRQVRETNDVLPLEE